MPEDTKPSDINLVRRFYDKCRLSLRQSDPPHFCSLCGMLKMEFENPLNGRIVLLDCDCERHLKMLKEFIDNYRECFTGKKGECGVKYCSLIDGSKRPANDDEERVVVLGRTVQGVISDMEHTISIAGIE